MSMMDELKRIRGVLDDVGEIAPNSNSGNNYKWYSLPKSTEQVKFRVLPHWSNPNSFPAKMNIKHYGVPAADQNYAGSVNCLRAFGMDCPVCNILKKYEGQYDGVSKHRPVPSMYFNVLILEGPPQIDKKTGNQYVPDPNVPHIVGFRESFYNFLQDVLEKPESSMVLDPHQGADMYVSREKANGKFSYRLAFGQRPVAQNQEELNKIMGQAFDLDDIWKSPDDDKVRNIVQRAEILDQSIQGKMLANNGTSGSQNYQQSFTSNNQQQNSQSQNGGGYQQQNYQPQQNNQGQQNNQPQNNGGYQQQNSNPPQNQANQQQINSNNQQNGGFNAEQQANTIMGNDPQAHQNNNLGNTTPTQQTQVNNTGGSTPTNAAASSSNQQVSQNKDAPPGAPQCFGDPNVHDSNNQNCVDCKYELHCIKAAGKEPGY